MQIYIMNDYGKFERPSAETCRWVADSYRTMLDYPMMANWLLDSPFFRTLRDLMLHGF